MAEIRNRFGELLFDFTERFSDSTLYKSCKGIGIRLTDADLSDQDLSGLVMEGAHFIHAVLRNTNFQNTDLYWANFSWADLTGANMAGAELQGAILECAVLAQTNLRNADLSRDNLGGSTSLAGADLSTARIDGAIFSFAKYSKTTKFPLGFRPEKWEMILVPDIDYYASCSCSGPPNQPPPSSSQ